MKEIFRIQIRGCSGYCSGDMAYDDVLTLTHNEIRYEYKPVIESNFNPARKWKYQTNSPEFRSVFNRVAEMMPDILHAEQTFLCYDIGMIDFTVTYEDKTRKHIRYWCTSDEFSDCFALIKKLVPFFETIPSVLS